MKQEDKGADELPRWFLVAGGRVHTGQPTGHLHTHGVHLGQRVGAILSRAVLQAVVQDHNQHGVDVLRVGERAQWGHHQAPTVELRAALTSSTLVLVGETPC